MKTKTELTKFNPLKADITAFVAPVKAIKVTDFASAQMAIETAKQVKVYAKQVETLRKTLVDPLNAEVKSINSYAKEIEEPLLDAERFIKSRLVEFEHEQEKIREAERQRLEAEAKKAQAELLAKQEAERQALIEKASLEQEAEDIFGIEPETTVEEKIQAFETKAVEEQTAAKNEVEGKQWDIDQLGVKNSKKIWKCEVIDLDSVPKEYLIRELNEKAVLAMARAGITNIPGVRVWQETTIAIGTNTYIPKHALRNGKQ